MPVPAPIKKSKASTPAPAATAAVKPAAAKAPRAKKPAAPAFTRDDIAVRAYLIAENRHRHGIHAEPHEDWIEAERQLQAELGRSR